MSDFGVNGLGLQYNTGTDASPIWSGTQIGFGGSAGANELRWAPASGATTTTASASWPYVTRPTSSTAVVPQLWAFTTDAVGLQVATYTGDNTKANVLRWSWDTSGIYASAPVFSLFGDSTHTAPVPGTQPPATHNDPISNGSSDTSNTSYLKAAAYGTVGTSNMTAGTVGTAPTATTGSAGAVTASGAAWSSWQSLQGGFITGQWIALGSTPTASATNNWNWTCVLYTGANMSVGTLTPSITYQYTFT